MTSASGPESPLPASFPTQTAWSLVLGAADRNSREWKEHLDRLVRRYWKPVQTYLMRRWNVPREESADLAQEFFSRLYEGNRLQRASPDRGRFRTFIMLELRDLVIQDLRKKTAGKRGGSVRHVSIERDADAGSVQVEWPGLSAEEEFDRVWAQCLLSEAMKELQEKLEREDKGRIFRAFWACAVAAPPRSYRECAEELGLQVSDVGNYVFRARGELRRILLRLVRESVAQEGEGEDELATLMRFLERPRGS